MTYWPLEIKDSSFLPSVYGKLSQTDVTSTLLEENFPRIRFQNVVRAYPRSLLCAWFPCPQSWMTGQANEIFLQRQLKVITTTKFNIFTDRFVGNQH